MNKNQYTVEICVNGRAIKEYGHYINGIGSASTFKTFIEGKNGTAYTIKLRNNSDKKVLAILGVDGLNVVSGKPANGYSGRGYIVGPHSTVQVKGFRISDEEVGEFKFSAKGDSYAASKNLESNAGVISVNFIAEKEIKKYDSGKIGPGYYPWDISPVEPPIKWRDNILGDFDFSITCDTQASSCYSSSCDSSGSETPILRVNSVSQENQRLYKSKALTTDLGTDWGNKVKDKITRTAFDKGEIVASFDFYYSTRKRLEEIGIKFYDEKSVDLPIGFEYSGYCEPPKGWKH